MNITLKSIKYYVQLSEETNCFRANLYIDGKRVGVVGNDGHGGETWVDAPAEVVQRLHAYATALPKKTVDLGTKNEFTYQPTPETIVDDLLVEHLKQLESKRFAQRAAKERTKNAAKGFPITIQLEWDSYVCWVGVRRREAIPAVVLAFKTKRQLAEVTWKEIA